MYTKLIIQIQCVLLSLLTIVSIAGFANKDINFLFAGWEKTWLGITFLVVYFIIFIFSILQIIMGLLEGRIFGLISGTFSALTFIPFVCFIIIPINILFLYKWFQKERALKHHIDNKQTKKT